MAANGCLWDRSLAVRLSDFRREAAEKGIIGRPPSPLQIYRNRFNLDLTVDRDLAPTNGQAMLGPHRARRRAVPRRKNLARSL